MVVDALNIGDKGKGRKSGRKKCNSRFLRCRPKLSIYQLCVNKKEEQYCYTTPKINFNPRTTIFLSFLITFPNLNIDGG